MNQPNAGESLGTSIAFFADLLAGSMADDLAVRQKLFVPRETYVKQKRTEYIDLLINQNLETEKMFTRLSVILKSEMESLPAEQKKTYLAEFTQSFGLLTSIKRNPEFLPDRLDLLAKKTVQDLLSFSPALMKWIYDVGYRFFKNDQNEDASLIFSFLVFLNGLVPDYRIALGFAQLRLQKNLEALSSFSVASLLNPNLPATRYNSAKIYLEMNQPNDALAELDALQDIIVSQNLRTLQPALDELKIKALQKISSNGELS